MFTKKLKMNLQDLSYNENLIANFIMSNKETAASMTSYDIAKNARVAQTSVIRFAKKLGYQSFKELQVDLLYDDPSDVDSGEVDPEEESILTIEKVKNAYQTTTDEMLKLNRMEMLDTVADVIYQANRVLCFGSETSIIMAKLLSDHLVEMGKDSSASNNAFDSLNSIRNMQEHDVLFMVSASGETIQSVKVAGVAKRNNVKIVLLTGPHQSTLRKMADYILVSSEYKLYTNMLIINNRCSQMFLIECLFLLIWKKNPKDFNEQIRELNYDMDSVAGWPIKHEGKKHQSGRRMVPSEKHDV